VSLAAWQSPRAQRDAWCMSTRQADVARHSTVGQRALRSSSAGVKHKLDPPLRLAASRYAGRRHILASRPSAELCPCSTLSGPRETKWSSAVVRCFSLSQANLLALEASEGLSRWRRRRLVRRHDEVLSKRRRVGQTRGSATQSDDLPWRAGLHQYRCTSATTPRCLMCSCAPVPVGIYSPTNPQAHARLDAGVGQRISLGKTRALPADCVP
jgi:hypothetical protein